MGHRIAVRSTPLTEMDEKHGKERILNVTNVVCYDTMYWVICLNKGTLCFPAEEIFVRVT